MEIEPRKLLFLCTGNYYRSRFAEILFNHLVKTQEIGWHAESRGLRLCPANQEPISQHAIARLEKHGITLNSDQRMPLQVTEEDIRTSDRVVAVKRDEHLPLMDELLPRWVCHVQFWRIHDLDCAEPDVALAELEREIVWLVGGLSIQERHIPHRSGLIFGVHHNPVPAM